MNYLILSIFFILSFFISELTGKNDFVPFYSWEMYSSVEGEIYFYELLVKNKNKSYTFSSLYGVNDGLTSELKSLLLTISNEKNMESVKEQLKKFNLNGDSISLFSVKADTVDFYKESIVISRELIWEIDND
jgi:hypothetical protein